MARVRYLLMKIFNEYDLIKEYERFYGKKIDEYDRKSAGMAEKGLHYLSKYTRLLDT